MVRKITWVILSICLFAPPCYSWAQGKVEKTFLATQMLDKNVYGGEGQKIGEIDDIVVKRNGKINKITIDVGGFLGIGEKVVAYPFDELTFAEGKIVVQATEAELAKRPEYNYYLRGLTRGYYYGPYPPYASPAFGPFYGPGYGPSYGPEWGAKSNLPYQKMKRRHYPGGMWAYSPARFLVSVVIGRDLINNTGEILGEIIDLVVSEEGQVEKIILSAGEILGDDTHVALPYKALGFNYYGVVYPITEDELKKMPRYSYRQ